MENQYPGIGIVGHESITALYGVDNGIIDWKGTGIQHFFHKSFEQDLIHSATTYIHHESDGQIELGNRLVSKNSHPIHHNPVASSVEDGFCFTTTFESQVDKYLSWTERVYATHQNQIVFETTFKNRGVSNHSLVVGGYVVLRNPNFQKLSYDGSVCTWKNDQTKLAILGEQIDEIKFYKESPTGFVYRTLQQTFDNKNSDPIAEFTDETMIGIVSKKTINIPANQEMTIRWLISASSANEIFADDKINQTSWDNLLKRAKGDWKNWIKVGTLKIEQFPNHLQKAIETNIIALKASLLDGFVPADITGHYYSNGSPSYYVRDALMIAKSLLVAGYYAEAKSIIIYAGSRKTKEDSGEFYQRYNAVG